MLYTSQNRNLRQTLRLLESSLDDMDKANRRNWRRHRLVSVKRGDDETMRVSYAPNGNILFKTGVGNFSYDKDVRPHAVTEVENADGKIPGETLTTSFNDFGKIQLIEDAGKSLRMDFSYGPDQERWCSELSKNGTDVRTTVYAGEYEKITENGVTREFYYLDGNTIAIRENGTVKEYHAFTDNLDSILSVVDENGTKVFDASYDAWGKQTVTLNTIGLHRGYTGHEMLSEFDIINMNQRSLSRSGESNGRLYDSVLGCFFSPDNYVQMPDNSQNFNRYSYCLNNPLKYTDPSGNLFGIDDAIIAFAAFNMASSMMQAAFEGKNVWKAGVLSLLSSGASYGIGELFKGTAATFGNELLRAGAHGLASGVISALDGDNFASAFVSGAAASGMGSYAQSVDMNLGLMVASTTAMGGVVAWMTGNDFLQGAMEGMTIGALNHAQHEQHVLINDQEEAKDKSRALIKNDPKYKHKIILRIQRDGKLSFEEAFYWYGYGDGSPLQVDASKLDLGTIPIGNHKIGDKWTIQTATLSGNYKVGLVYGSISVIYVGNNNFKIQPDIYDFDIHWKMGLRTLIRNIETIGASYLHGTGTPFKIIFNGLYHNK